MDAICNTIRKTGVRTFSTDGSQLFEIESFSTWPLMIQIENFLQDKRTMKDNVILLGNFPGPEGPRDIGSFLAPALEELDQLCR